MIFASCSGVTFYQQYYEEPPPGYISPDTMSNTDHTAIVYANYLFMKTSRVQSLRIYDMVLTMNFVYFPQSGLIFYKRYDREPPPGYI